MSLSFSYSQRHSIELSNMWLGFVRVVFMQVSFGCLFVCTDKIRQSQEDGIREEVLNAVLAITAICQKAESIRAEGMEQRAERKEGKPASKGISVNSQPVYPSLHQ